MHKKLYTILPAAVLAAILAATGCAHNGGAAGTGTAGATSTAVPTTMANGAPLTPAQQQAAKNVPPNFQKQFFGSGAPPSSAPSN